MVKEGKVSIKQIPEGIFYNPWMEINRDLSVLVLKYLVQRRGEVEVCDPLCASGIRELRFLEEVGNLKRLVAGDLSQRAIDFAKELLRDYENVFLFREEANLLLRREGKFDFVEIDPFGSPVPFLESAIVSLRRGGIISITATDTAPLSGNKPEKCFRRYGSLPLRSEFMHEFGIRILIKKVIERGAELNLALRPIFAYYHRHHYKVFFTKEGGGRKADELLKSIKHLSYCFNCLYRKVEEESKTCPYCGSKLKRVGKAFVGNYYDQELFNFLLKERQNPYISKETKKLLSLIAEEAKMGDVVGFYTTSSLGKLLKLKLLPTIKEVIGELPAVRSHVRGDGFKTRLEHRELLDFFSSRYGGNY